MTAVSVVIVSHNTRELLRACLRSLEGVTDVLVVDSASTDGSPTMVRDDFPSVRLLESPENLGYTRGNNRGIRLARGQYILLLNPDTVVAPGAIETMAAYLDAHSDVGVVGPRLEFPDGTLQPSRFRFPGRLTAFVESTVLQRWLGGSRLLRDFYVADRRDDETQDVDWVRGAAMMVRRAALDQAGLFDERFFMYSEEVDLCRRIKAAGWRVVYVPTARVVHYEGKSSEQNLAARDLRFHESRFRYYAKHHGPALALALRVFVLGHFAYLIAEETGKLTLGHRPDLRRQRVAALRSVLVTQARQLVGL